ncbi:MAG: ABC transporter transmembrane domain-containing protein, partial [Candidatus Limnocylindria bacterium]
MGHGHGGGGGSGGFVHDDEILGKAYDATLTRRLVSYLKPYGRQVALAVVLLFLMSATQILPPVIAKFIIDTAIAPAVSGAITQAEGFARLAMLGAAFVAVLAAASGFRFWQNVLTTSIGQRAMYDLRLQLFRHLQYLSLGFFDRNPVGRLMTRITNDIDALTEMVSRGVVSIFGDLFTLAAVMVVMLL